MSASLVHSPLLRILPTLGAACMALLVIAIRMKAAGRPTSLRKIAIPPVGMSTGFLMFLFPVTHISIGYALTALLCGFILAVPLIRTSVFHVEGDLIYLKRSKAFVLVLLGLLVLRIALHSYVEEYMTLAQTGALFFLLAFGMIGLWRLAMIRQYMKLKREYPNIQ